MSQPVLNYQANNYVTLMLSPESSLMIQPQSTIQSALSSTSIAVIEQVGNLPSTIKVVEVPKAAGLDMSTIVNMLKGMDGVLDAKLEEVKMRVKRGGDEF